MKRYFILGTDTDCGKTTATCQLLQSLRMQGLRISAFKPLASGCEWVDSDWVSDDARRLQQHGALAHTDIPSWRFPDPIAPHLAAAKAGTSLSAQAIAEVCLSPAFGDLDALLIEGAGGLMVPLNESETWVDVLVQTQLPVILVVGMRLGCINHALLTAHALTTFRIPCVGWVANCLDPDMKLLLENQATLVKQLSFPCLLSIPFLAGGSSNFKPLPELVDAILDAKGIHPDYSSCRTTSG